jgi:hypothetical protein
VRNRNSEAYARAQDGLPLLHGPENFVVTATGAFDQVPSELGNNTGLIAPGQGHHDPIGREQLGQEHGMV